MADLCELFVRIAVRRVDGNLEPLPAVIAGQAPRAVYQGADRADALYALKHDGQYQIEAAARPGSSGSSQLELLIAGDVNADGMIDGVDSSLTSDFLTSMFISANRGVTWDGPYASYGGDKQWIQVDRTGGMGHGHIYQAWSTAGGCCGNNIFNRSTNGGFNFSIPNTIPATPIWGTMDTSADGTLWLAGVDPGNLSRFIVARSTGAKDRFAAPLFDFTKTIGLGGAIAVQIPDGPSPAGLLARCGSPSTAATARALERLFQPEKDLFHSPGEPGVRTAPWYVLRDVFVTRRGSLPGTSHPQIDSCMAACYTRATD